MAEKKPENVYQELSKIDVSSMIDKKNGLSYLSWAKAWGLVKSIYPNANYKITEFPEYIPIKGDWQPTGRKVDYRLTYAGCEVEATVQIDGREYTSKLYVMDNRNRVVKTPDYFQINKTQMRCLVKALAFAGLGLNVYAGEDLPSEADEVAKKKPKLKKYTDEELNLFKVNYHGKERLLFQIWKDAEDGNEQAKSWWRVALKHKDTEEGNAVAQFTSYWNRKAKEAKKKSA